MKAVFQTLFFVILVEVVCGHWHKARKYKSSPRVHYSVPAPTPAPTTPAPTTPAPTTPAPTTPAATGAAVRAEEGLLDYFHHDNDDQHDYHYDTPYEHNHYENNGKHCYAFDTAHGQLYKDISETGTEIAYGGTAFESQPIDLLTSFKFYDTQLTNPTVHVAIGGFIGVESAPSQWIPNMQQNETDPFAIIAPLFADLNLDPAVQTNPAVYYETSSSETIVQWNVNPTQAPEYNFEERGVYNFQVKILSSGDIFYSYGLMVCDLPITTCPQIGIKPSEADLTDGYKTSFVTYSCIDGQYGFPRTNDAVLLRRVYCNDLNDSTGLLKPLRPESHNNNKGNNKDSLYDKFDDALDHLHDFIGHN